MLVVDIGGGSTELVLGSLPGDAPHGQSVDIGSVRLTERHLADDPPTAAQVDAVRDDVDAALDSPASTSRSTEARTVVGVAGTVTTVAAMVLDLAAYDRERVNRARISRGPTCSAAVDRLAGDVGGGATCAAVHASRPGRRHRRRRARPRGVIERLGLPELVVSTHDILDGIAWSLVDPRRSRP